MRASEGCRILLQKFTNLLKFFLLHLKLLSLTFCLRQISDPAESKNSLKAILTHSLFSTEEKLLAELDAIMGKKGTRIIIWNLRRYDETQLLISFVSFALSLQCMQVHKGFFAE